MLGGTLVDYAVVNGIKGTLSGFLEIQFFGTLLNEGLDLGWP